MTLEEYLLDEARYEWEASKRSDRIGQGFSRKAFGNGPGRPSYTLATRPEGFENPAHFHNKPQFQVIWRGSVRFPNHPLDAIAVHYSDAFTPYGPFVVGADFLMGAYRPRMANQTYMTDREGREKRNPYGREIYGRQFSQTASGQTTGDRARDVGRQVLISKSGAGPGAELLYYAPLANIPRLPAPHGEFQIVAEGSAEIDGHPIGQYSARWTRGDEKSGSMRAGPKGVTLLTLTFDEAADGFYE